MLNATPVANRHAPSFKSERRWVHAALIGLWALLTLGALGALTQYKLTPGPSRPPQVTEHWSGSPLITLASDRPTLLVTVHPHCPCTRATFTELQKLLERHRGRVATVLLFVQPDGEPSAFVEGALWDRAEAFPDARRVVDLGGAESKRLGAETSGTALLYGADGALRFRGGLTISRGHEGQSPGATSISHLLDGAPALPFSPVFGCALSESSQHP